MRPFLNRFPAIGGLLLVAATAIATGGTSAPTPTPAAQPLNLSTRMLVQTGDNVGIGGFIITGTAPKQVTVRGLGPSLVGFGVPNPLADPVLELHGPPGFVTIMNDNWRDSQTGCLETPELRPTNDLESAICGVTLDPGAYTAILRGKNNDTGIGLVEVYDVYQALPSKLANFSTRAIVNTGNDIVIAGFILGPPTSGNDNVVVRGIGPSLTNFGVPDTLADPQLELRDGSGTLIRANNNWMDDPTGICAAIMVGAGLAPTDPLESAICATLAPGQYTALLSGVNNGTGVGLVEMYDLFANEPFPTPTPGGTPSPSPSPAATPTPTPSASPSPSAGPCVENFDGVVAPALPSGWVATNPDPGDGTMWATSTSSPDSAPNCAFVPDQDGISDKVLDSPPIAISSATAVLSFRNNFDTEFEDLIFLDGGVLEVSSPNISSGDFLDITDPLVGGTFVSGGYTGEISSDASNPLAGRMAWSGNSVGYINTVANLGPNVNGQTITLRFRMGTDEAVAAPGWRVDTISITGSGCPTPPPSATPTPTPASPTPTPGPCVENFDGVTAPALPPGWVASNPDPGDGVLWMTTTAMSESAPNNVFLPDQDGLSDKVLDRTGVNVTSASATLSFRNNFNTEFSDGNFCDGGVLEVSSPNISGGAFLDITDSHVGGSFVSGGYTAEFGDTCPALSLAGRMNWAANSNGYIDTVINLGPNLAGQTVTFRFRFVTDEAVAAPGWRIDNLVFTGASCP